ncbi:hypothetical protein SAMN05192574_105320 [Mucilaginibacter gossypiicola]|uniref:YubB ferredoxin-like domain-containing protein n=1 Tax=Mucilaginibacter gossypiicola TaxID=551995 RepID=A0A1H8LZG5_9SPHI|nr:hypothetical protein [Mucilaginibacter gossypiicola]SEO10503.1 hypothetical protein SAMN05192574_105320 [Mucilaginibacter gossypiicola]
MFNRYNNAVEFNGKAEDVLEVLAWFKELIYDKGAGWQMGGEKFSNISFLGDGRIWFESNGDSGPEILREIAEEFRVGFVHYFGKNSYYGEAVFSQGNLHITVLDEDDLGSIGYDETIMSYTVGQRPFANHRDAIDHLLAQKKLENQPGQNEADNYRGQKR